MPRLMQNDEHFPTDSRDLAKVANLPVPSWHVGRMYEDEPLDESTTVLQAGPTLGATGLSSEVEVQIMPEE